MGSNCIPLQRWDDWLAEWSASRDSGNPFFWTSAALDSDSWRELVFSFVSFVCNLCGINGRTAHVDFDLNVLRQSLVPNRFAWKARVKKEEPIM